MKIKNIKKIKNKYQIILENNETITTNDNVIINSNLLYKKKLTIEEITKIKEETIYYETYNKIIQMINRKLRSEYEIKKYLDKNEVSQKDQNKMIQTLKEIGLINDKNFAESYTNDKINLSMSGPYKIKKELEDAQIDNLYIENALQNFKQEIIDKKIEKIINKKLQTNKKDTEYIFKQKIFMHLSNLGYSKEDINEHLENIKIDNSKLKQEMEKIFNQLKLKYDGYTLKTKLKQKLYQKGFKSEEINNFIEKTVH